MHVLVRGMSFLIIEAKVMHLEAGKISGIGISGFFWIAMHEKRGDKRENSSPALHVMHEFLC